MAVYSSSDWELISRVALPTLDSRELSWSPDSAYLAVWDGPAHGHKIVFYTPVGELLATQTGHRDGLGVKAMSWSPSGQLLTVGTFDQASGGCDTRDSCLALFGGFTGAAFTLRVLVSPACWQAPCPVQPVHLVE